jgi:hypothetical protein
MSRSAIAVDIKLYEPWMRQQLIALNESEYPFMKGWFTERFRALYESDYTRDRHHLVTAVRGEKVLACISYIQWPLSFRGQRLNAYQMVGLLVHPSARGMGLFRSVLSEMDTLLKSRHPDVVFGFPVAASRAGFLRQGWQQLFDLAWYIAPVNLKPLFSKKEFNRSAFETAAPEPSAADQYIQTTPDQDFWKLRTNFYPEIPLYHKIYKTGNARIQIFFRIQKIKGVRVAVAGRIYSGSADADKISRALELWITDLQNAGGIVAVMIAMNEATGSETLTAIRKHLQWIPKKIPAIIKSYNGNHDVLNAYNWNIMRGDMETW